jgi:membrane protein
MKYMVFLNWIDDVLERAFDIIGGFFNVIWSFLCSIIYGLITLMFNIFTKLTQMDILDAGNININGIYQRMTMIITIIMIFYITFEFIKYVLQPDTINDKEKGAEGIIKRIVIAILLIAFIPTVFTTAMKLQDKILETNVIPKVIFGQKDFDYKNAGSNFSGDVFAAFYRVNYENCQPNCQNAEKKVDSVIKSWKERQGLAALAKANAYEIIDIDNSIQFDGLLAVIFGCFALYVIFLYCIDMGVRFVQLLFLQIIAPVAAISYIIPQKDSMLNKWIKQVATTYLDVFIRYAVLYFMLLIMSILSSSLDFYELSRDGKQITIWLYIFIVMGLLIFVQRAPKLIEELLPKSSGAASIGFGFSGKSRFEPLGKTISSFLKPAATIQGVASGVKSVFKQDPNGKIKIGKNRYGFNTDLVKDIKGDKFWDKIRKGATYGTSAAKAGYQGAKAGAKTGRFDQAKLAAQQSVQQDEAVVNKGGSVLGATFRGTHYQEVKADIQVTLDNLDAMIKAKQATSSAIGELKFRKQLDSIGAAVTASGDNAAITEWQGVIKGSEKAARNFAYGTITKKEYERTLKDLIDDYNNGTKTTYTKDGLQKIEHLRPPKSDKVSVSAETIDMLLNEENLEINNDGKWSSVKTSLGEALKVAKEIAGTKYDKSGKAINVDESEFASQIGDISDEATAAINLIKASDEYKEANTNASEGKK